MFPCGQCEAGPAYSLVPSCMESSIKHGTLRITNSSCGGLNDEPPSPTLGMKDLLLYFLGKLQNNPQLPDFYEGSADSFIKVMLLSW